MEFRRIISVDIEKLETSSIFIVTGFASSFDNITQIDDTNSLGVPLVGSLSAGFTIGLIKG